MEAMRKSWTDERLDHFEEKVDHRFDEVDRRFTELDKRVDRGFDKCEVEFHRINDRLDGMHQTMVYGIVGMTGAMFAGYAATIGLVLTLS
jgi:tetrahydromethanopterin S-methyltransferase subunit G